MVLILTFPKRKRILALKFEKFCRSLIGQKSFKHPPNQIEKVLKKNFFGAIEHVEIV